VAAERGQHPSNKSDVSAAEIQLQRAPELASAQSVEVPDEQGHRLMRLAEALSARAP
jgi:hypothetical protein